MESDMEKEWLEIIKGADLKFFPGKTAAQKLEMLITDKEIDAKLEAYFAEEVDIWLEKLRAGNGK